jgi:hypothetical protein
VRTKVLGLRHADSATLDRLEALLSQLRQIRGLKEVRRGVFYRRSKAFMHFHDDPSGLYADVRLHEEFERYRVDSEDEQRFILTEIRKSLSPEQ